MAISTSLQDQEHARALALAEWESRVVDLKDLFFKLTVVEPAFEESGTRISGNSFKNFIPRAVMRDCLRCCSTLSGDGEAVEWPKLSKAHLLDMCEKKEIREHLNLIFGEPRGTQKGMERLLDLWVVLDLDDNGELSLDEFTDGLGRLHEVIRSPSADAFMMMRLVKLHYLARQERQEQTRKNIATALKHQDERRHASRGSLPHGYTRKENGYIDGLGRR